MFERFPILLLVFAALVPNCLSTSQFSGGDTMEIRTQNVQDLGGLPDLYEASIAELQEGLERRAFTSVDLVKVRFPLLFSQR